MINNIPTELETTLQDVLKMKLEAFIETAPNLEKRKFWEYALEGLPKVFKGISKDCAKGIYRDWYYFTVTLCYRIYFRSQQQWMEKNSENLTEKIMTGDIMGALSDLVDNMTALKRRIGDHPMETIVEVINKFSRSIIYSLETVPEMNRLADIPKLSVLQDRDVINDILSNVMNKIDILDK